MASIKSLGNGKYRVFICDGLLPNGKVNRTTKTITAKSEKDAERQAQTLEVDFKRGQQIQFANAPTFMDLVEKWRKLKKIEMELHTQWVYEKFLESFMIPYFGRMKVRDIKAVAIEEYLKTLSRDGVRIDGKDGGYSEKTIHHHFMFLKTLFNYAIKWDMIEINPCVKVDKPKVHKKEARCYEDADIAWLLECLDKECCDTVEKFSRKYDKLPAEEAYRRQQVRIFNDYQHKVYVWLALASACRRGELIGLKVDQIDFEKNAIYIKKTGHYTPDKGLYFVEYLKNGEPSKIVHMPITVMNEIQKLLKERETLIELMGWEDGGYLFISLADGKFTRAGGPMLPDVISTWFSRFIDHHGLPKITLHQVRHTSISYLINKGVDVKMIADRAGHKSTRTTEEIYSHIFEKTRRATADEYDELFNTHKKKEEEKENEKVDEIGGK